MTNTNKVVYTLELFSGTKSFSSVAERRGYATHTVDNDCSLEPDECVDIRDFDASMNDIDLLWASPPCQGFSVAVIGRNWHHNNTPKTKTAELAVQLVNETLSVIDAMEPKWFFIENPRGKLRSLDLLKHLTRHTVTYCQYGDTRMKPTDIWTNAHWWKPKQPCKNGMPCHESAPRGSRTGTQGIDGAKARGVIPPALFEELFDQYEKYRNSTDLMPIALPQASIQWSI